MTQKSSRRNFLGTTAALGSALWVAPRTFAGPTRSALEGLTAACVGVGGKGDSDCSHIADQDVEIVGICDVDRRTLEKKGKSFRILSSSRISAKCWTSLAAKLKFSLSVNPQTISAN